MKMSFRCLSFLLTGAAFVTFSSMSPNCSPPNGSVPPGSNGGDNSGGDDGNGGDNSGGKSGSGSGGATNSGGSQAGGSDGSGGATNSGGSNSNGGKSGSGGKTGSGGSSNNGGRSGSGGATSNGGTKTGSGGTTTSNGGTTTTTTTPPASGGSGGGTTSTAAACTPPITSTGGLSCPGGLCTINTTIAGYTYKFVDSGGSKICMDPNSLCAVGSTGVADTAGTVYGAGIGFNLDKSTTPAAVPLPGTGVTVTLSSVPTQGMRLQVHVGKDDYCAVLKASGTAVPWTDFSTTCWNTTGTKLAAGSSSTQLGFEVTAGTAAATFDFCVKSVTFQ